VRRIPRGEKTAKLWKGISYRKHMEDAHRKHLVPSREKVNQLYKDGFSLKKIAITLGTNVWQTRKKVDGTYRNFGFQKGHKTNVGKKCKESAKEKIRISNIKYIEKKKLNGEPLTPNIGKYETRILDNLEYCFGYPILRQYRVIGYFLDGFCPMLNLAIEVDELFHKEGAQLKKDMVRESNIKNELNCLFLRININKRGEMENVEQTKFVV